MTPELTEHPCPVWVKRVKLNVTHRVTACCCHGNSMMTPLNDTPKTSAHKLHASEWGKQQQTVVDKSVWGFDRKRSEGVVTEDVTFVEAMFSSYQLEIPAFPFMSAFSDVFPLKAARSPFWLLASGELQAGLVIFSIMCFYKHERMQNTEEVNKVQTYLWKYDICHLHFPFFMLKTWTASCCSLCLTGTISVKMWRKTILDCQREKEQRKGTRCQSVPSGKAYMKVNTESFQHRERLREQEGQIRHVKTSVTFKDSRRGTVTVKGFSPR